MKLKIFSAFLALCVLTPALLNLCGWTILSRISIGDSDLVLCSQKSIYIYGKSDISGKMTDFIPDETAVLRLIDSEFLELLVSEPITIRIKGRFGLINKRTDLIIYYPLLLNLILPATIFWYAHRRQKRKKVEEEIPETAELDEEN